MRSAVLRKKVKGLYVPKKAGILRNDPFDVTSNISDIFFLSTRPISSAPVVLKMSSCPIPIKEEIHVRTIMHFKEKTKSSLLQTKFESRNSMSMNFTSVGAYTIKGIRPAFMKEISTAATKARFKISRSDMVSGLSLTTDFKNNAEKETSITSSLRSILTRVVKLVICIPPINSVMNTFSGCTLVKRRDFFINGKKSERRKTREEAS